MNTITKIIGLVAVIAIIISSVAIGISINTSNQTSKLNTEATQLMTVTFNYDSIQLAIPNIAEPNNITINKVYVLSYSQSSTDTTIYLTIPYSWISGHTYTISVNVQPYFSLTEKATAPTPSAPTATPTATPTPTSTPTPTATPQPISIGFFNQNNVGKSIQLYTDHVYISNVTVNGVEYSFTNYGNDPNTPIYNVAYNWQSGVTYTITVTNVNTNQIVTYTATAP